ncbi:hypothetical protein D3C74_373550 [compost metagenome]
MLQFGTSYTLKANCWADLVVAAETELGEVTGELKLFVIETFVPDDLDLSVLELDDDVLFGVVEVIVIASKAADLAESI